jgi:hypothetical protein
MKNIWRMILAAVALLAVLAISGCAPTTADDGLIFGSSYRLGSGETINHDLAIFGGSAILEDKSKVNGSVAIFGGSLVINGEVDGDVAAFGGAVSLGEHALVTGNVVTYGASVSRSDSAIVNGSIGSARQPIRPPFNLSPIVSSGFEMVTNFIWRIFQSFALAALAVLVSLFALRPMERTGDAIVAEPVLSAGMGFLTLLVSPILLVVLAITIILSPLSLLGFLILVLAALFGWMVLGLVTGERLAHLLNQEWSGPVSAGVGTLVLSLAMNLIGVIPCVGWAVVAVIFVIGLGGVVLTRFGIQSYPPRPSSPAIFPPAPTAAPPGPEGGEIA